MLQISDITTSSPNMFIISKLPQLDELKAPLSIHNVSM